MHVMFAQWLAIKVQVTRMYVLWLRMKSVVTKQTVPGQSIFSLLTVDKVW